MYSTPFEPVCAKCHSTASASALISDDMIDYLRCDEKCPYIYGHCVNGVIRTVQCSVRQPLLQNVLPELAELSYETYLHKKASNVYMLRQL